MRIAEKILERRAKRCRPLDPDRERAAEVLAIDLLVTAGQVALAVLGAAGPAADEACRVTADAVAKRWISACHGLRFARSAIEIAAHQAELRARTAALLDEEGPR
jgi:hypothetical protein